MSGAERDAAWQLRGDGISLSVRVTPKASREAIGGKDGVFAIRLTAPPVDGAANKALVKCLSKAFKVAKRDVVIEAGDTARTKRIFLSGDPQALAATASLLYDAGA